MSPFYLEHGFHPEPIQVREPARLPLHPREIDAREFLSRQKDAIEHAQAMMAAAQASAEDATN